MPPAAPAAQNTTVLIVVAIIGAAATLLAALVTARYALVAKRAENNAERVRDLENRLSEKKYETYQPMIDWLREISAPGAQVSPSEESRERMDRFSAWIAIFGSDRAITAWHNMFQAVTHGAAGYITLRLYAEFVLAARMDMGYPETGVDAAQIIGVRITDAYDNNELSRVLFMSLPQMFAYYSWTPPWPRPSRFARITGRTPERGINESRSVEGFIAGLVLAGGFGYLASLLFGVDHWWKWIGILPAFIALVGLIGLLDSLIVRDRRASQTTNSRAPISDQSSNGGASES